MKSLIILILLHIQIPSFSQKLTFSDSVYNYICQQGIKHPEIVMKQAILETGWFKGNFLMSRNNLFGFRKIEYLRFESWKKSVEYYKKWQDKRYTTKYKDYYDFLVKIKYATPEYPSHLKKIAFSIKCK
jgi:hypothetical protein